MVENHDWQLSSSDVTSPHMYFFVLYSEMTCRRSCLLLKQVKVSGLTLKIVKKKICPNLLRLASLTTDHTRLNEAITVKHLSIFNNWAWIFVSESEQENTFWWKAFDITMNGSMCLCSHVGMASAVPAWWWGASLNTHNILSGEVMRIAEVWCYHMIQYLVCMTCHSNFIIPHFKWEKSRTRTADLFTLQSMFLNVIISPCRSQVIHTYINILQLQA